MLHPTSAGVVLVLALVLRAYALAWRGLRSRAGAHKASIHHLAAFAGGLTVLLVALVGPLDWAGERRLMVLHMLQHILVMSVAPALLLAGLPAAWVDGREQGWGRLGRHRGAQVGALATGVLLIWTLHVPAVLNAGLRAPAVHDGQHLVLLGAGLLVTWPLIGPARLRGLRAVAYVAVAELAVGALGMWLAWYPQVVYAYEQFPRLWDLSASTDQSLAGALLLVLAEPFLVIEVAVLVIGALGDDDEGPERG